MIKRKRTRLIKVGKVKIGSGHPIVIQSMTKTKTRDVKKTVKQIKELEKNGCEIIRVAVKNIEDAKAIKKIKRNIKIPLVADIHFDFKLAIEAIKSSADKIRINPGNLSKPEDLEKILKLAKLKKIPIRIGLNSGSLSHHKRNMVSTAKKYINFFEKRSFRDIIISVKSSDVAETIASYRKLSALCNYPLHLGVTASGSYDTGIVKSSVGIGTLLAEGIGDTIRVSLTGDPVREVIAAKNILQALKIRRFNIDIISCPTCGRSGVDLCKIVDDLESKLLSVKRPLYAKQLTIALMGCEVNGPGEAKEADIGIAFGKEKGILFKSGKIIKRVKTKEAVKELLKHIA